MALLLTYLIVALAASFLCSLLEASLLSVPRSHVAVMVERGSRAGQRLLLILVFSEIIPKTLGAVHAKRLAGFTARAVHGMIVLLLPVVAACDGISKLLARRDQSVQLISRDEVRSLAGLAHEEGAIDRNEARVMRNLFALRDITVREIMTPRTVVSMYEAE